MKLPTFRLRITLLSSALATITLIGFGIVSWLQIYHANLERLDAQIVNLLMRGNAPPKNKVRDIKKFYRDQKWELYANSLDDILGTNARNATGLLILEPQGNSIYQSSEITIDPDLFALIIKQLTITKAPPPRPIRPPSPDSRKSPPPPPPIPLTTQSTKTGTWRIGTVKFPHLQLAIAVNHQVIQQEMATVSQIFLISVLGIFILIAISAWFLSKSILRPINQLTNTIQQVSVKGLDRRISLDEIDVEFRELVQVFNQMMERLERSFHQSSRFSADAAHELKTPLTILQGELERMLHQVENGSEIQQSLGHLLDETISLSGIMRKLLLLSLADAGQLSLYLIKVNISELLWQMLEDLELLAPHLDLKTNIAEKLIVKGDRDLLMQVIQNLVSNAIKYNLPNGWIEVEAKQSASTVEVIIKNSSQGILISDRDRIFERFYRGDSAHNHKIEGIGLGLNLAREIVRAHNGELILSSTSDKETSFLVCLPIAE